MGSGSKKSAQNVKHFPLYTRATELATFSGLPVHNVIGLIDRHRRSMEPLIRPSHSNIMGANHPWDHTVSPAIHGCSCRSKQPAALTPTKAGTRFIDPYGIKATLTLVILLSIQSVRVHHPIANFRPTALALHW